jgi:hypothetical protein
LELLDWRETEAGICDDAIGGEILDRFGGKMKNRRFHLARHSCSGETFRDKLYFFALRNIKARMITKTATPAQTRGLSYHLSSLTLMSTSSWAKAETLMNSINTVNPKEVRMEEMLRFFIIIFLV